MEPSAGNSEILNTIAGHSPDTPVYHRLSENIAGNFRQKRQNPGIISYDRDHCDTKTEKNIAKVYATRKSMLQKWLPSCPCGHHRALRSRARSIDIDRGYFPQYRWVIF